MTFSPLSTLLLSHVGFPSFYPFCCLSDVLCFFQVRLQALVFLANLTCSVVVMMGPLQYGVLVRGNVYEHLRVTGVCFLLSMAHRHFRHKSHCQVLISISGESTESLLLCG